MTRSIRIFSIMVVILLLSSGVMTQPEEGKETLKGLKGFDVLVDYLDPDIEKDGLRRSSIQTDVELKLRLAGIKVLTLEESAKEPGSPYLYISVNSMKAGRSETGLYAYNIAVELRQYVILLRDKKIMCTATTWTTGGLIGTVGKKRVESIRDSIKDIIDIFINDYLAMNPKEKKSNE